MAAFLSPDEVAEFQAVFSRFDLENKGTLETKHLGSVLQALEQHVTDAELRDMINDIDQDGSGTIDFPEFLTLMARKMQDTDAEEEIKEAYRVFDKNGDGFISAAELRYIITNVGEKLTDEEVEQIIQHAQPNAQGQIDYAKFISHMISK